VAGVVVVSAALGAGCGKTGSTSSDLAVLDSGAAGDGGEGVCTPTVGCPPYEICLNGMCVSVWCTIDGTVYAEGQSNPANPCQVCNNEMNNSAWSPAPAGTTCVSGDGGGGYCQGMQCEAGCFIGQTLYAAGTVNPEDPCQACTPASNLTDWSNLPDGLSCGSGGDEFCAKGMCQKGCVISGSVYAAGSVNSANTCQNCQPNSSQDEWTSLPAGTSCTLASDAGSAPGVCNGTLCIDDCYIGGAFYPAGTLNSNGCQMCDPMLSTSSWSTPTTLCATGDCGANGCTGETTTGTSCQNGGPGLSNCGAGGSGTESCCTSIEVPGGGYFRSYNNDGTGPTDEADPATVSGFRLDKYLVTVGRYRQFVSAWKNGTGWLPEAGSGKHTHLNGGQGLADTSGGYETGWDATHWNNTTDIDPTNTSLASCSPYATWTDSAGSQENLPINCVNWYEAYAFCIWDGGFLPSEAEWEYAAADGSQQLEYPWGSTNPGQPCPGIGCQYAIHGCLYPSGSGTCLGVSSIAPVGTASKGAGAWGHLDLAGEVWEWTLDWYGSYVNPCVDCANLVSPGYARVFRGGDFFYDVAGMLPPYRNIVAPQDSSNLVGFRCARTR
jgi:formylglycine-generating enzyme required for sulfatase activity